MLGLAIVCACIGFALAFVLTLRHSAWDLDRTYFENNSDVLSLAGLFGGSIGWFIGAGIGWFLSPSAIRPSQDHAWRLRVAAVLPAAIAVLIFVSSTAIESPEAQTALAVIPAGAALVSVTLWSSHNEEGSVGPAPWLARSWPWRSSYPPGCASARSYRSNARI